MADEAKACPTCRHRWHGSIGCTVPLTGDQYGRVRVCDCTDDRFVVHDAPPQPIYHICGDPAGSACDSECDDRHHKCTDNFCPRCYPPVAPLYAPPQPAPITMAEAEAIALRGLYEAEERRRVPDDVQPVPAGFSHQIDHGEDHICAHCAAAGKREMAREAFTNKRVWSDAKFMAWLESRAGEETGA